MKHFLSISVVLLTSYIPLSCSFLNSGGFTLTSEWTCSGCWSTNPENATNCKYCGRPR